MGIGFSTKDVFAFSCLFLLRLVERGRRDVDRVGIMQAMD